MRGLLLAAVMLVGCGGPATVEETQAELCPADPGCPATIGTTGYGDCTSNPCCDIACGHFGENGNAACYCYRVEHVRF